MHRRMRVPPRRGHEQGAIPIRENQPTGRSILRARARIGPAQNRHRPHAALLHRHPDTDRGGHHIDHEQRHERVHHRPLTALPTALAPPR